MIFAFMEPIRYAAQGIPFAPSDLAFDIFLDASLNVVLAFFFGLLIFGLLGVPCAKLFFLIQKFKARKVDVHQKFIMLKTTGKTTGGVIIKRGFLLYCVAISLTLSTLQFVGFFASSLVNNQTSFTLLYTALVLIYMAFLTFFLPSIWYLDDINLMYFTISDDVKFLNPMGQSILPALKGFGSFSIIIAYLIYIMNGISRGYFTFIDPDLIFDPILTLFVPLIAMLGFEIIAEFGQRTLKKWIVSKNVHDYDELKIELVRKGDEYQFKVENEPIEGKQGEPETNPAEP